jgi:hypothetical protein
MELDLIVEALKRNILKILTLQRIMMVIDSRKKRAPILLPILGKTKLISANSQSDLDPCNSFGK